MSFNEFDEYETSDKVRDWLRANLLSIIGGVALGAAALWGWQFWKDHQATQREAAEAVYRQLADAAAPDATPEQTEQIGALSKQLQDQFGTSRFATLGSLLEAKLAIDKGELAQADEHLNRAMQRGAEPALENLVQLRLAELRLAEAKPDAALALLDRVTQTAYRAAREELRGDSLLALGRNDDAWRAYDDAVAALDEASPNRRFVELKRDAVARPVVSTPPVAAPVESAPNPDSLEPAASEESPS